jgi:hypothetical protein
MFATIPPASRVISGMESSISPALRRANVTRKELRNAYASDTKTNEPTSTPRTPFMI